MEPIKLDLSRARWISEWRTEQFIETQDEFAKRLGVSMATLSSWETGRKAPRLRMRRAVAQKLGIPVTLIVYPSREEVEAAKRAKKMQPGTIETRPAA